MTPTASEVAEARVCATAGAMLLDRHARGWAHQITRPIDVSSGRDCPVGQTFGSWDGIHRLQLRARRPDLDLVAHGFLVGTNDPELLNGEWGLLVADRKRNPLTRLLAVARRGLAA